MQGYLDHLTIERGVAANTISSYRRDLRRYAEHLGERGNRRPAQRHGERRERFPRSSAAGRPGRTASWSLGGIGGSRGHSGTGDFTASPRRKESSISMSRVGQAADADPPTAEKPDSG